ncbi:MAG: helix-turn-helix domain-containing protein [Endomicrobiaceae bacterium]
MFGVKVKLIRKKLKKSQKEFSDFLEVSQSAISNYEKNERTPSADFLNKLAEKCNINMNWFLTGKGEMFQTDIANQELEQLKKEIQALKKTIDTLEKEHNDLQAHNKELDSELTKRRLELLDCQSLLIKLQQRNV